MNENLEISGQQYVSFRLAQELFGVEVARTKEILSLAPVTQVPQTPHYMLGVLNLRGQVVPVIDMRLKMNLAAGDETEDTCIIVVEVMVDGEPITVGALADAVREVIEIRPDQIEPPPKLGDRLKTEVINGMGKIEDQFIILLNIDRIFNADEIELLQDVGDHESSELEREEELAEE